MMDRQELLYRGAVKFEGDDAPTPDVELWASGRTVIAFTTAGGTHASRLVLHNATLTAGDAGSTIVAGDEGTATALQAPQYIGAWTGKTVTFPNGDVWTATTIEWANLGVKMHTNTGQSVTLLGARTYVDSARKYIAMFGADPADDIEVTSPASECGRCGG